MAPRDHHFFFAKKMIPTHTFQSTDKMFSELTGPKREAFVFWLWNEAGKQCGGEQLPHVGPDGGTLKKLEVVGRIAEGGTEVIVISMPPAVNPNEAMFLALVRRDGQPSVFFYERCMGDGGAPVHPTEAVLAEVRPDGSRINHGFKTGLDLAAFKQHLGEVLGISLAGLEASLPAITMAAFRGEGGGAAAGATGARGSTLETLLLVRAGLPLVMFALARTVPSLLGPVWQYTRFIYTGLSLVIGVMLLVWLYRVHAARREQASFSPGWAVGVWFIPGLNAILAPLSVRSAHKAATGSGAGLVVLVWWLFWLVEIGFQMLFSFRAHMVVEPGAYVLVLGDAGSIHLPDAVATALSTVWSPMGTLLVSVAAYGLLWHIVRSANSRL